jgi:hypothetical protein
MALFLLCKYLAILGNDPKLEKQDAGCSSLQTYHAQILQRLASWKEKLLSMRGKEILLKAIIQSIPVFAMGGFKLCKEINDAIAAF